MKIQVDVFQNPVDGKAFLQIGEHQIELTSEQWIKILEALGLK